MYSDTITADDFEIFKEALFGESLELHVELIQKLTSLAKALGGIATREELLPLLNLHYPNLHDETLFNLAVQLKNFVPLVGGIQHSKLIFELLEKLCVTDENIVREKAVESLISIQQDFTNEEVEEYLLPVVNRLTKNEWFTGKCSAVALYTPIYPKLTVEKKSELRNNFKSLIQDDSPIVRKAAAMACINFVGTVEDEYLKSEFVPIFQDISQDPMDSVRAESIEIGVSLLERLQGDGADEMIFKNIEAAGDDFSWRLKQRLANCIDILQRKIPSAKYRGKLLALFQKLTRDMEAEVRILAASNLFNYCKYLKDSYLNQPGTENNFEPVFEQSIMTIIQRLSLDENEDVRLAISSNILPLSTLLSEDCFKRNIMSFLLEVLEREESIAIQANFLLGLSILPANIDLTRSLNALKNAVRAIIVRSQSKWRTRRSILMTFVDIAKFCSADYFSDNFKIYYAALLGDPIFAVRRSASLILPILSKHYGMKWASEHLVPYFTMFTRDTKYLYRFVPLFGINEMINPHLCSEPHSYLEGFRILVENTDSPYNRKAILALVKIVKTSHLIQKELSDEKYSSIMKLQADVSYLSDCADSYIYSEKDFDKLRERCKTINLFSLEEKDLEKDNWPYLQGLMSLIYNKFLPIIDLLNKDVTENIQIRAISTLAGIYDFIAKVNKEENADWVQKCVTSITAEETHKIIEEIHEEFKTANFQEEDLLDTDLAVTVDTEIKNMIIVNSDRKEINVEKDSLVKEVMEIVDKKFPASNRDNVKSVQDEEKKDIDELKTAK